MEIRNIIIDIAKTPEKEIDDEDVKNLLLKFLDVKYSLKFINIQRVKKSSKIKSSQIERLSSTQENTIPEHECTSPKTSEHEKEEKNDKSKVDVHPHVEALEHIIHQNSKEKDKTSLFEECQDIFNAANPKEELHHLILF